MERKIVYRGVPWFHWRGWGFTVQQELFCWEYAYHGSNARAARMSHKGGRHSWIGRRLRRQEKILERIQFLRKKHKEGVIDLAKGPYEYYNIPKKENVEHYKRAPNLYQELKDREQRRRLASD
tara:strand:- start:1574 stop:1942 length:369 start_codon:yes stop_codon:yes gene_type:complete